VVRPGKTRTSFSNPNLTRDIENNQPGAASDPTAKWQPNPDVVTQLVEGETVLVHLQTNEIYALNPTATRAWDLLETGMNREAVQETLQREFDVPSDQLRAEIDTLITTLVEKKLLRAAGS
jgi:Coenzyme PQQ synthesis protein D (PqqD)